jgi:hypothetical protein
MAILRDLGDANEGDFSRAPPVGTPLQRQICAHYTRVDGSLNYSGYFSKLLGFSVHSAFFLIVFYSQLGFRFASSRNSISAN